MMKIKEYACLNKVSNNAKKQAIKDVWEVFLQCTN